MIRYILVDDMPNILKRVKNKIDSISEDYGLQHIKSYSSSKKAYEEVNEEDYDLLIVDFEMPVYNGLELALKIAKNKQIIFLTSTNDNEKLVINKLNLSGFLSKPFDLEEFKEILKNKVIKNRSLTKLKENNLITLHIGSNRDVRFKTDQVYYISASRNTNSDQPSKNCVHIYGLKDELLFKNVRISISGLYKKLESYNFEKTNQSTIINMLYLNERDNSNISLFDTKETFKVTTKEKKGFVAKLRDKLKL